MAESNGMQPPIGKSLLSHPAAKKSGAPPGVTLTGEGDQKVPSLVDEFGRVIPSTTDPAWQAPRDPMKGTKIDAKAVASLIFREVPLSTIQTSWTVPDVRQALADVGSGLFAQPAMLCDSIIGDDRVQATLGSRTGGLLGQPVRHRPAQLPRVKGSDAAKECHQAWLNAWPRFASESSLSDLLQWGVMLGFGMGQLVWEYDEGEDIHCPYLLPWQPRYTYYHWTLRCFVAVTLDGQVPVTPGDAHWVLHAPHGEYRGWMRGALRAIAQPWLIRAFAYRDWARYSERHGLPIFKALTPAAGDPVQINAFAQALAQLGQESVIQLPQGVEKEFSYGLEMLEAQANTWQGFAELIDRCEKSITLAVLYQNLTTDVKEGSLAAARVHGDVRQTALEADERALARTIYQQVARPFAAMNFGDPDLAPVTHWDVRPEDDKSAAAKTLLDFANSIIAFRRAGVKFNDPVELARAFGIKLSKGAPELVDPISIAGGSSGGKSSFGQSSKKQKFGMQLEGESKLWLAYNQMADRIAKLEG